MSLSKTLFAGVLNSLPPMTGAPYFASIFANNDASSPAYLASKPPTLGALAGLWRRKYLRVSQESIDCAMMERHGMPHRVSAS